MPGPRPTPTSKLKLTGSWRADARKGKEPLPPVGVPVMPDWLSDEAVVEWHRIVAEMLKVSGLLTRLDGTGLAMYCQVYADYVSYRRGIEVEGRVVTASNGNVIQNPLVGMANRAFEQLRQCLIEFGMTPAARARLLIQPQEQAEPDEFAGKGVAQTG